MADNHDHDHDHDSSSSHDLLVAKCGAMATLFCATTLFGCIPFMLNCCLKWTDTKPNSRSANIVQWLLYFGGGVLLATTFLHLLPEVQEVVEHLQECGQLAKTQFALAEVLMCTGFFLMYFLEECVHSYLHRHKKQILDIDDGVGATFERGRSVRNSVLGRGDKKSERTDQNDNSTAASVQSVETSSENRMYPSTLTVNDLIDPAAYEKHSDSQLQMEEVRTDNTSYHQHEHNHDHDHGHGHGHSHLPLQPNGNDVSSSLRGLGIVLALSLHEIFEGMAIGLEDSTQSVWFLLGAVSAHKLVLAFCVGVELIVAHTKPILAAVYTITFAITSPIGIGIGLAISHNSSGSEDSIPSAILQGIACGTLLYVVFFEILSKQHAGLGAFIAMLIGFGVMFGLQNIGEPHDHNEDTCPGDELVASTTTVFLEATTRASG